MDAGGSLCYNATFTIYQTNQSIKKSIISATHAQANSLYVKIFTWNEHKPIKFYDIFESSEKKN